MLSAVLSVLVTLGVLVPGRTAAPAASASAREHALERELRVRAWALGPSAHREELAASAADQQWTKRFDALDALRRAQALGRSIQLPRPADELLRDPHPNVRALGVALVLREERRLEANELERLAADPFPGVRSALARALGARPGAGAAATLLALSADPDPRVAALAARLLFAREPGELDAKLALLERGRFLRSPGRFAQLLELGLRAPPDPEWTEAVRARLASTDGGDAPARLAAMRALWEALAYVSLGAGDARVLAAGWLAPLAPDLRRAETTRAELLSRAARAGDRALLAALLDAVDVDDEEAAGELLDAAVDAGGGAAPALLADLRALPAPLVARVLGRLTGRVEAWPADELARWLDPGRPLEVRRAACLAAGDALLRAGDRASGEALARALDDPDDELRWVAFEALCDVADPRPWLEAVHGFWRALETRAERLEALRELSRAAAPAPFREDLIALWESGRGRTPSVLDLLRLFRGDEELAARLIEWLDEELAQLDGEEPPPEEVTDGPWRRAEGRAQALVRTLERVGGETAVTPIERVLARVDGRSAEVAKVCAGALAKSAEGRRRLVRWTRPEASSRVRIEAALGLVAQRTEDAVTLLLERYDTCDEELRLRVLRAFGPLADPRCVPLLAAAASESGHSAAERVVALEALGQSARPEAAARALASILERRSDPDLERGAVASLGQLGHPDAAPALRALLADPARRELARDEALPALARLAPEEVGALLLAAPLDDARAALQARFLGERTPATEFRYRGELAAAEQLAARGLLGAALDATPDWWGIDGRLLLELGRTAARAGARDTARRLLRAARVALAGEGEASDLEGVRCGARVADLVLALEERDWRAASATAGEVLLDWRTARTSERGIEVQLGFDDPRAGRDAQAWLAATGLQAAAFAALERGARDEARALALRAARAVGRSERAREQQERLEAALR